MPNQTPKEHTFTQVADASASLSEDGSTVTVTLHCKPSHFLWLELTPELAERLAVQLAAAARTKRL